MSVLKSVQKGWFMYAGVAGICGYSVYTIVGPMFHLGRKKLELCDQNGTPIPLSYGLSRLNMEVIQRIDMDSKVLANYNTFICKGNMPTHIGSLHSRGGCVVGIPQTFNCQSPKEADCIDEICKHYNTSSDKISEILPKLSEALTFSENAKKFAISRELYSANTYKGVAHCVYFVGTIQLGYTVFYYLEKFVKPNFIMRLSYFFVIGYALIRLYYEVTRVYNYRHESRIDEKSAKIGPDFASGGIEFYEKCDQIEKLFLPYQVETSQRGSFISSFFGQSNTHMSPESRKAKLEEFVKASNEESSEKNDN